MGSFIHTLLYFVVALGILITFHEFGHFWVARRLGVRVLKFSVGFGKPLWRYQKDPDSTEFVVAGIPLGGYVKMLDEREGEVANKDLPYAFNRQTLWVRTAVVSAGPLFNLLLAILIYWFVFCYGEMGIRSVLGPVDKGTFAQQAGFEAGDEILKVDGQLTPTWNLAMGTLITKVIENEEVTIEVQASNGVRQTRILKIPSKVAMEPELLRKQLGFTPWTPQLPPVIEMVEEQSPADLAGLKSGDLVVSADTHAMKTWQDWVEYIRARPEVKINLLIEREGLEKELILKPTAIESSGVEVGRIGASVRIRPDILESMRVEYKLGFVEGFEAAAKRTADFSILTLKMMGRMLTGRASIENLSGPISIAKYAGQSASLGLVQFLKFLAIVSISLGVLNLLPIPVLDGGHLMYFLVEAIKGSPVSDTVQLIGQQVGIVLLLSLMSLAVFLDIERLLS